MMTTTDAGTPGDGFEDAGSPPVDRDQDFVVRLEAYEGPLDVLLDHARDQKVDLGQISILALADQYLAFVEHARRLRLELAADYLVMAAWLAYLKSRLLLPQGETDDDEPSGAEMAEALAFQLRRLEAVRRAGARLLARPQLGVDRFARGVPEVPEATEPTTYTATLFDLLRAYADHKRRTAAAPSLHVEASRLVSMEDALGRLVDWLGGIKGWADLMSAVQAGLSDPLVARSELASTFAASLELARDGRADLRQDAPFGPIYVRRRSDPP